MGKSDHDHLGKLITYLTALEANTAIWIVPQPRPEHITAVTWLNESTAASFYLIKLEGIRIGDSDPAPLLTVIVGPSEESREIGEIKKEEVGRYKIRKRFWTGLLDLAKTKTPLHGNISPGEYSWIGAGAGKSGLSYNYTVTRHDAAVELYIDKGKDSDADNKKIFDALFRNKAAVENTFGGALDWQRLDNRRACRIEKTIVAGGYADEDKWPEVHVALVDSMIALEKALKPFVSKLNI